MKRNKDSKLTFLNDKHTYKKYNESSNGSLYLISDLYANIIWRSLRKKLFRYNNTDYLKMYNEAHRILFTIIPKKELKYKHKKLIK